jgi:hypothetical protein
MATPLTVIKSGGFAAHRLRRGKEQPKTNVAGASPSHVENQSA